MASAITLEQRTEQVAYLVTANGSEYHYLPDGRTQRFKKSEGKWQEPQDVLVFVPDFEWIKKNAPQKLRQVLGESSAQYEQLLLEYVQGNHQNKKSYIVDKNGNILNASSEVLAAEQVFLAFGSKEKVDFYIPISKTPKLGYLAYDSRRFVCNGESMRERHLGNKVTEIVLKK